MRCFQRVFLASLLMVGAGHAQSTGPSEYGSGTIDPTGGGSGLAILTGSGAPAANSGTSGQVYLDTTVHAEWLNTAGTWNQIGFFGAPTASPVVPIVAPSAVALSPGTITNSSIQVTWGAATGTVPLTYKVEYSPAGAGSYSTFAASQSALSATIAGLAPSTAYDIRVTPLNASGAGTATVLVGVSTSAGAAPTLQRAVGGNNTSVPFTSVTSTSSSFPCRHDVTVHFTAAAGSQVKVSWSNYIFATTAEYTTKTGIYTNATDQIIEAASIEYPLFSGTFYPLTFGGVQAGAVAFGSSITSDAQPTFHPPANSLYAVHADKCASNYLTGTGGPSNGVGNNGDTYFDKNAGNAWYSKSGGAWGSSIGTNPWGANGYILVTGTGTNGALGENSTGYADTTAIWATGLGPRDAAFVVTPSTGAVNAAAIASVPSGGTGANYTTASSIFLWDSSEQAPATISTVVYGTKLSGYWSLTGGTLHSATVSTTGSYYGGKTPTGAALNAPIYAGPGGSTAIWGPSLITFAPDLSGPNGVIVGNSIDRGYGSSDRNGDYYRAHGLIERVLEFGADGQGRKRPTMNFANFAVPGMTAEGVSAIFTSGGATAGLIAAQLPALGTVIIGDPTNSFAAATPSSISVVRAAIANTITSPPLASAKAFFVRTTIPRSTCIGACTPSLNADSSGTWGTEASQQPINATFDAVGSSLSGGIPGDVDRYNCAITAATVTITGTSCAALGFASSPIPGQTGYVDVRTGLQGTSYSHVWRVDQNVTNSSNHSSGGAGEPFGPTTDGIHPSAAIGIPTGAANTAIVGTFMGGG